MNEFPADSRPAGDIPPWNYPPMPPYPSAPVPMPAPPQPPKKGRKRWIMIGIGIVVLLAILPTIVLVQYITASTPDKTLDAFCNAVLQGNYQDAYAQFSPKLQQAISEASLASVFSQDKVTACTHGTTDAHGTSVTDTLKLVHASQGVNKDIVTLVKGSNNIWQIDDIYQQT